MNLKPTRFHFPNENNECNDMGGHTSKRAMAHIQIYRRYFALLWSRSCWFSRDFALTCLAFCSWLRRLCALDVLAQTVQESHVQPLLVYAHFISSQWSCWFSWLVPSSSPDHFLTMFTELQSSLVGLLYHSQVLLGLFPAASKDGVVVCTREILVFSRSFLLEQYVFIKKLQEGNRTRKTVSLTSETTCVIVSVRMSVCPSQYFIH